MKLIRPVTVDDTVLTSSNIVESEPQWSAATTYALAAIVRGTGGNSHLMFQSLVGSNLNNAVTDATKWTPAGSSNRYSMFDDLVQSQTTSATGIAVQFTPSGRVDTVALLNVSAATVSVIMTDAVDGVVFNQTFSMIADSGIDDWYRYFTEPLVRLSDLIVTNLPAAYANPTISITISDPGGTAACGVCLLGQSVEIGGTQYGASVGIQDYSVKQADAFGNYVIVPRAFAKRGNFAVRVASGLVDQVQTLLASFRATPILWIGSDVYASTAIFGFFKDFTLEIDRVSHSLCTLEIEGLT